MREVRRELVIDYAEFVEILKSSGIDFGELMLSRIEVRMDEICISLTDDGAPDTVTV